jgi:hypothetical protein
VELGTKAIPEKFHTHSRSYVTNEKLEDVYYMVTHLDGVWGTAKAELYGMMDGQSGYNGKAKTASGVYVTTTCW